MSKLSNIRVLIDEENVIIEIQRAGLKKVLDILMEKVDTTPEARTEEPVKEEEDDGPTGVDAEDIADHSLPKEEDEPTYDLFEPGPTGFGGEIQDVDGGRKMIEEIRGWLKDNRFNYRNFCLFLSQRQYLAGWKLSKPIIGTTAKGEPSLFKLAARYYTYWKASHEREAFLYKKFLADQLEDYGVKVEMIKDILDGKEVDPKDLPKGIEVYV